LSPSPPEPPIRFLATILASLLLAVGLAIAGYSFLLTLRRAPLPTVDPEPPATARQVPAPARLPADPTLRREPVPASVAAAPKSAMRLSIALQNVPPGLDPATAGVALFATDTGAEFQWLPLSACRDGAVLEAATTVVGSLTATLATDRGHARHGYLAQKTQTFARAHRQGETLILDAASQTVRFELANTAHRAGPLALRRVDDPNWQASTAAPTGLQCRGKEAVEVLLGAGVYELADPIDAALVQRFTVPSPAPITIREGLSRPATGHP
jgi:hypothetical protein